MDERPAWLELRLSNTEVQAILRLKTAGKLNQALGIPEEPPGTKVFGVCLRGGWK